MMIIANPMAANASLINCAIDHYYVDHWPHLARKDRSIDPLSPIASTVTRRLWADNPNGVARYLGRRWREASCALDLLALRRALDLLMAPPVARASQRGKARRQLRDFAHPQPYPLP